jgi:hypothetical protein
MKLTALSIWWGLLCCCLSPLSVLAQTDPNLTDSVFLITNNKITLPAINLSEILNGNNSLVELAAVGSNLDSGSNPFKTQITKDLTWQLRIPTSVPVGNIQATYTIDPLANVANTNQPKIAATVAPKPIQVISTDLINSTQIIQGTATITLDLSQVRFSGKYAGKMLIRVTKN